MSNRERYLLKALGDDQQATAVGLDKFLQLCKTYGDGVIYIPTMKNVESTLLASAIGEQTAKNLAKHKSIKLNSGQHIYLCSDRTFNNYKRGSVYIVLWATPNMIETVEREALACKAIVVVTWLKNEADAWASNYKPTEINWSH